MKQIVKDRKDIVFYLKMFPIKQLHPDAYDKSKAIVCAKAKSNKKALKMLEDVYAKKKIPAPTCKTDAVDANIKLAAKFGINGTPAMIFDDGSRASGYMTADKLIPLIDAH